MAAAAGPSSSFACSSICPSSASFHKNVKLESSRYSHGQKKYGMLLLSDVEVYVGKSGQIVQRSSKSKKGLLVRQPTFSATSEGQPSFTELDLDTSELEVLQFVSEDDSLRSSLSHLTERTEGKPGFISFCGIPYQRRDKTFISCPSKETSKIFWLIGLSVLVAFLVFPSLYLRKILSTIFEDSLLTAQCVGSEDEWL